MKKKSFAPEHKLCLQFLSLSIAVILSAVLFARAKLTEYPLTFFESAGSDARNITVILDAGHGGEDAGASSDSGLLEKDINLKLCEHIRDILGTCGITVRMTRTEDKLLYTEEQNIKGQRKHYDLLNRYLVALEYDDPVFVSVHTNKFQSSKYKGLQVYYSDNNELSAVLAQSIQSNIHAYLQEDNNRKTKNANSSIYLLDRLECAAVLVECGFLSNTEDCEKLQNDEYIKQMAFLISDAILQNLK